MGSTGKRPIVQLGRKIQERIFKLKKQNEIELSNSALEDYKNQGDSGEEEGEEQREKTITYIGEALRTFKNSDFLLSLDDKENILSELGILERRTKKRNGSKLFFNLDSTNIDKFLEASTKFNFENLQGRKLDSKLAEFYSLAKTIKESDENLGIIFPVDPAYGFADYFTYDKRDPKDSRVAVSVKYTQKGGRGARIGGFESTFGLDFSKELEEKEEKIVQRKLLRLIRKEKFSNKFKEYYKKSLEKNQNLKKEELEEYMKKEILRALRGRFLLENGDIDIGKLKEVRINENNNKEEDIPIIPKNLGISWHFDNDIGLPVLTYKLYKKEETIPKSFSSSIQKAVRLLKSPSFSEAGFKKFMHENKLWQAI